MIAIHQVAPRLRKNRAYLDRLAARQSARHGAAGAHSLDTYHAFGDRSRQYRAPRPLFKLSTHWQIDRHLGRHLSDRRLEFCGKWVAGDNADLKLSPSGRRARWTGVASCRSWDCPRCARHKADHIAHRLSGCIDTARDRGWYAHFVTLTMGHAVTDTLARCVRAARAGWSRVRRLLSGLPYVGGVVSAIETTLGSSGWHVHCHAIVWTTDPLESGIGWHGRSTQNMAAQLAEHEYRGQVAQLDALHACRPQSASEAFVLRDVIRDLEDEQRAGKTRACRLYWAVAPLWYFETQLVDAWQDGVADSGMWRPNWRQQRIQPAKVEDHGLVRYILKTAYEISGQPYKRGRGTSFTPRGLLESAAAGCHEARRAWREYREATAGMHRIQGLHALERTLDVRSGPGPQEEPIHVASVDKVAYLSARRISYDRLLVRVCEWEPLGSVVAAQEIIERAGPMAGGARWRRAASEVLGPVRLIGAGGSVWDCRGSAVGGLAYAIESMYNNSYERSALSDEFAELRQRRQKWWDYERSTDNDDPGTDPGTNKQLAHGLARRAAKRGQSYVRRLASLQKGRRGEQGRRLRPG